MSWAIICPASFFDPTRTHYALGGFVTRFAVVRAAFELHKLLFSLAAGINLAAVVIGAHSVGSSVSVS